MEASDEKKGVRVKIVVLILTGLLVLSAGGLAVRTIYQSFFAPEGTAITVRDNLIREPERSRLKTFRAMESCAASGEGSGPHTESGSKSTTVSSGGAGKQDAVGLELYRSHPEDNIKFEVRDLLPGDSLTRYYRVKVYHNADIPLFFGMKETAETKSLSDALHIRVTNLETGKALCSASFSETDGREFSELLAENAQGESTAYYKIEVSVDTSVGNEYQAAMLNADFCWSVKDEGGLTPPPQTGDASNILLWTVLALSSFVLMILLYAKRRKGGAAHEPTP